MPGNRCILKYALPCDGLHLTFPADAVVVHVHERSGDCHLWVLATWDSEATRRRRFIRVIGNETIPPEAQYLGTAHIRGGVVAAHAFEVPCE